MAVLDCQRQVGLEADTFLLEYDSPRDGTFEPLRFLRPGTSAVLGLVTIWR